MKKIFSILIVLLTSIIFFVSCSADNDTELPETKEEIIEEEIIVEDTRSNNEVNEFGVPRPLTLHYKFNKSLPSSEFKNAEKWYKESSPATQLFQLYEGDEVDPSSSTRTGYIRVEAEEGLKFQNKDGWHALEVTMKISRSLPESFTIAQLFESQEGPQMRVEMRSDGKINIGSIAPDPNNDNKTNINISNGESYINKPFKLKIRSDGNNIEVYFNESLKYSGKSKMYNTAKEQTANYHFRWGIYYNYPMPHYIKNEVSEILRYKE